MCPECGRDPGSRDARFCGHCGALLEDPASGPVRRPGSPVGGTGGPTEEHPRRAPRSRVQVLAIVALIAGALAIGTVSLRGDGAPGEDTMPSPSPPSATDTVAGPLQLRTGSCPVGEDGCVRWRLSASDAATRVLGPATFGEYGYVGVDTGDEGSVRALRLASGQEVWSSVHDAPVSTPPAVGEGIVTFVTGDQHGPDTVHAVAALSGQARWHTQLDGRVEGPLAVLDEVVFVPIGDAVLALDVATGIAVGRYPATGSVSPSVLDRGGLVHYGHEGGIQSIDRAAPDGGWSVPAAGSSVAPKASRFGVGGVVVVAHADGRLAAYRGRNGDLLWERRDLHVPDLPPLVEDHFLVALREGRFVLLHPWTGRSEPGLGGEDEVAAGEGSPRPVGDPLGWHLSGLTAYVVHEDEVVAYNVRRGGTRLWSQPLPSREGELPGPPVVSLDVVMVPAPGELLAFNR